LLNTVGLLLGILGVVILFKWGPPQPNFDEDISIGISFTEDTIFADGSKPSDTVARIKRRKLEHQIMSRIGPGLVGLGFAAQLLALWWYDVILTLAEASS
jgi:hypothetical protein